MTVTCHNIQKVYTLGVEDQLRDQWAFFNGKWWQLRPDYEEEKWFEDYRYGIVSTRDMLECWLSYLPGVSEWDDHGDFFVIFDMDGVKGAGWSEQRLIDALGDMATCVRMDQVIHADAPWPTHRIDSYGNRIDYYRYPAIEPLEGMLYKDYPSDLAITG